MLLVNCRLIYTNVEGSLRFRFSTLRWFKKFFPLVTAGLSSQLSDWFFSPIWIIAEARSPATDLEFFCWPFSRWILKGVRQGSPQIFLVHLKFAILDGITD